MTNINNAPFLSVRNPLVAYKFKDYVKGDNGHNSSALRADLDDIADKVDLTVQAKQIIDNGDTEKIGFVNSTATALGLSSGSELTDKLKEDGLLGVITKYAEGLNLIIATDDLSRISNEKQRKRETMQYKWNRFWAWGDGTWSFRQATDKIPQIVKELLGMEPQSGGLISKAALENLQQDYVRIQPLRNEGGDPSEHPVISQLATIAMSNALEEDPSKRFDMPDLPQAITDEMVTKFNEWLTKAIAAKKETGTDDDSVTTEELKYPGLKDFVKELSPKLEENGTTIASALGHIATLLEEDRYSALKTAFEVLAAEKQATRLFQFYLNEPPEEVTMVNYFKALASDSAAFEQAVTADASKAKEPAPKAEGAEEAGKNEADAETPAPPADKKEAGKAEADAETPDPTGFITKRFLDDTDLLTVGNWNADKPSSARTILSGTNGQAIYEANTESMESKTMPKDLEAAIRAAVLYINEHVVQPGDDSTSRDAKLSDTHKNHLLGLKKSVSEQAQKDGFFQHIQVRNDGELYDKFFS